MIQQSFGSTGRHAAAGGERDACAPGCISASQQERAHENHLHAQLRMKGVALGLGLSASGEISAAIPCLSLVGARAAWSGGLVCRLRLAAAHGVACGCHSGAAAASVQRGRGCCWGGGGALCHRQWSGACLWSGRGGCRRFSPRGPRGGAPPPWAFFGEGPEKGGSGGLPRRCLQRFYARAKPGLPAASWPGAAGSDHGSPLSTQVAPMPWAMSTSVAHPAAASSLRRRGG